MLLHEIQPDAPTTPIKQTAARVQPPKVWTALPGTNVNVRVLQPCIYRGPDTGKVNEVPCCGGKVRREVQFTCSEPTVAGMTWSVACQSCKLRAAEPPATVTDSGALSVVISTCNEKDLDNTVASVCASTPRPVEIVAVDDAGTPPVPYALIRNERRIGSPRCRQAGLLKSFGPWVAFIDGHMRFPAGTFDALIEIARSTGGIAYCGCNGHAMAHLRMGEDGLLYSKWTGPDKHAQLYPEWADDGSGVVRTNGMMGASYVAHRDTWMQMGGWVGLPGCLGSQELTMSMLAARHRIPIHCDLRRESWHDFRDEKDLPFPPDHCGWLLNMCCAYRFTFDDPAWAIWRRRLARGIKTRDGIKPMPESILREAESPYLADYGRDLRVRFVVSDEEFMARFGGLSD